MFLKCHFSFLVTMYILLVNGENEEIRNINFCFNSSLEGFRLNAIVVMTKYVCQWIDCVRECASEPCCRSVNYKHISSTENESNCEMLHNVVYNVSEQLLERNSQYDYLYLTSPIKRYNECCIPSVIEEKNNVVSGSSCLDIKNKSAGCTNGKYFIDPDGDGQGKPFEVKCDMTSFGGGWTMCYTTDSYVNIKTELTTTPELGYRADCNNIPFTEVMFVDEESKQKAAFTKDDGPPITFAGNYNKPNAKSYGLWTANKDGVATTEYKYQMLICDTSFFKGLHFSGYTNNYIYKRCGDWHSDISSVYFRTSASRKGYYGVAFNENGHASVSNRLMSVGIR
ncbi:uncharacterized protein LOC114519848 [Dendronephthya gigantea]|uniref:uncharacterized protein LOC114519848 n=1 Tax=Dendronephthya gigantea TaxID=151771 RepID=UPI00106DB5B5|nr:uncharacterized protein LOC114519848 [Dendronephthya gigantea]